mgnify:CR=1 FL=1
MKENKKQCLTIGGQAVLEGVMMRGRKSMAIAVRDEGGNIRLETKRLKEPNSLWHKIPVIRGVLSFVSTMVCGIETLMRSAEVFGESEPSKFEKWLAEKFKINIMSAVIAVSMLLGIGLAVALFILLPTFLTDMFFWLLDVPRTGNEVWYSLTSGAFKILVLIGYLAAVSLIKDIRRTFMYHGAEHKTIACYESGLELTAENASRCSKHHDRCGTTFLFYVIFVSVLVFIAVQALFTVSVVENYFLQVLIRILITPLVAGLAYELLKFLAKHDLAILRPLKWPGLALQRLTTKEPTPDMLEVAIAAFKAVLEMENDDAIAEVKFKVHKKFSEVYAEAKGILSAAGIHEAAEADWIFVHALKVSRGKLNQVKAISPEDYDKIIALARKRAEGQPLQYVLGETEFCGYKIKVTKDVFIPRPDTESVAEKAWSLLSRENSALDLCTGSGCIAIAVQKRSGCKMWASDASPAALEVARQNAEANGADITFVESDMFAEITGRFDLIVCNPPYIKSSEIEKLDSDVKDCEPRIALDGGEDGLRFYRIIADQARHFLNPGGWLMLEIGERQAEQVEAIFAEYNEYKDTAIYNDLSGNERIFTARFIG